MQPVPPACRVRRLSHASPEGERVLDELNFDVLRGEIFGILGPPGAGKSALARMLAARDFGDGGEVSIFGVETRGNADAIQGFVGYVGQVTRANPALSVRRNLYREGSQYHMNDGTLQMRIAELCRRFELPPSLRRNAADMPANRRRCLDMAMALVHRPSLVVLDEPTIGVDDVTQHLLWREILRLRDEGVTVVIATSDAPDVEQLCDRMVFLDGGRIVASGAPAEVNARLQAEHLHMSFHSLRLTEKQVKEILAAVPGIHDVAFVGRVVRARVTDGLALAPRVVAAFTAAGAVISDITIRRASLYGPRARHADRTASVA